jgi:hypothetical protein
LVSNADFIPDNKNNSVPRRIPPNLSFMNITESELLQILIDISTIKNEKISTNDNLFNETEEVSITRDQYKILKLIQHLNFKTSKSGYMSQLIQCIRSLSFLRCIGIFVWSIISSNLPPLPFHSSVNRNNRAIVEEYEIKELFGVSSSEFKNELETRKDRIESNLIQLYKNITQEKLEINIAPLKIKGDGNGELIITFLNFQEARLLKFKDNNLSNILNIISETIEKVFDSKLNKIKNTKQNSRKSKRNHNIHDFEESNFEKYLRNFNSHEYIERTINNDQIINILLEKLQSITTNIENKNIRWYFNFDDAHTAFELLFGSKVLEEIVNQLKFFFSNNFINLKKSNEKTIPNHKLKLMTLEVRKYNLIKKLNLQSLRNQALHVFETSSSKSSGYRGVSLVAEILSLLETYFINYTTKYLQEGTIPSELIVRLPGLNDNLIRKEFININGIGKILKTRMNQMMPTVGLAISFIVQLVLTHAKAAASVAGLISNMALGSAVFGMTRDMLFGSNNHPKIKYIYDTEKYDTDIS